MKTNHVSLSTFRQNGMELELLLTANLECDHVSTDVFIEASFDGITKDGLKCEPVCNTKQNPYVYLMIENQAELAEYWDFCKENIEKIFSKQRFPSNREARKNEF